MTTLVLSILNRSSSFLQTISTTIKAWMSLNFDKIPLLTSKNYGTNIKPIISRMGSKFSRIRPGAYELPALERLEKSL